jgi:hypothetical protein
MQKHSYELIKASLLLSFFHRADISISAVVCFLYSSTSNFATLSTLEQGERAIANCQKGSGRGLSPNYFSLVVKIKS